MARSAWGLSSPAPDTRQAPRCSDPDVNPDWWTAHSWQDRGYAAHQCLRHCPVLEWCERNRVANPKYVAGTVRAGVFYVGTIYESLPCPGQPQEVLCPECRQRRKARQRELAKGRAAANLLRPLNTDITTVRLESKVQPEDSLQMPKSGSANV